MYNKYMYIYTYNYVHLFFNLKINILNISIIHNVSFYNPSILSHSESILLYHACVLFSRALLQYSIIFNDETAKRKILIEF